MRTIRVLLASRPKMLSEVIADLIARQTDMEVVGEVLDPIELLLAARATSVDVVIVTPLEAEPEPRICRHLLLEHPHLRIVTMPAKGNTALLYRSDAPTQRIVEPSGEAIVAAIRQSMNQINREQTHD